jgi:ATP-dependent Clp protease ATP-binding subunit ClpA
MIEELNDRLVKKGIRLVVSPRVKRHIIDLGYDEKYGARPLRRAIEDELEHPLAEGILSDRYKKGTVLKTKLVDGHVNLEVEHEPAYETA